MAIFAWAGLYCAVLKRVIHVSTWGGCFCTLVREAVLASTSLCWVEALLSSLCWVEALLSSLCWVEALLSQDRLKLEAPNAGEHRRGSSSRVAA